MEIEGVGVGPLGAQPAGRAEWLPRIGWYVAAWVTIALSVLKGLRLPNRWAASHHFFHYEHGFVKRGLVGELVRRIDADALYTYDFVCVLSISILALDVALVWKLVKDVIDRGDPVLSGLAIVYTSSLALVYLSHTIGYFDHVGMALVLAAITTRSFWRRTALLAVLGPLVLLVHEGAFVLFFPVALFSVLASATRGEAHRSRALVGLVFLYVAVTYLVGTHGILSADDVARMQRDLATRVSGLALEPEAFAVLSRDGASSVSQSIHAIASSPVAHVDSIGVVAPSIAVFVFFAVRTLAGSGETAGVRRLLILAGLGAALAPMTMRFLGIDMHRWDCIAVTTSFATFYVAWVWAGRPATAAATSPAYALRFLPLIVALIALNASSMTSLFDGEHVKAFPFFEHRRFLVDGLRAALAR